MALKQIESITSEQGREDASSKEKNVEQHENTKKSAYVQCACFVCVNKRNNVGYPLFSSPNKCTARRVVSMRKV